MSKLRIRGDIWFRFIHDTWENVSGYRTDIAHSTLHRSDLRKAVFVLDDKRAIVIQMTDLKEALKGVPVRANGMVGPFNVNAHRETVDGVKVSMRILQPDEKA